MVFFLALVLELYFLPAVEIAAQSLCHRHGLAFDVYFLCYKLRSLISCNAAYLAQLSTRTSNIRMSAAAVYGLSFLNMLIPRRC